MKDTNAIKENLHKYLELTFAGAEKGTETEEFMEELYADLCDKFDDLCAGGMSENEAYNHVISGIGTPEELFLRMQNQKRMSDDPSDSDAMAQASRKKLQRRANLMISLAIALYILCPVPILLAAAIAEDNDMMAIFGVCGLLVLVAAATALIIYAGSIRPKIKGNGAESKAEYASTEGSGKEKSPLRRAVDGAFGLVTLAVYLLVSFLTEAWHLTWLIFLIGVSVSHIIDAVLILYENRRNDK